MSDEMYALCVVAQRCRRSWHYGAMPRAGQTRVLPAAAVRVRRGYFEYRYGQLHVHNAMPPGGGFEEGLPLLCVHDFTGSGRVFAPFAALAAHDRSVYAPDLPGFGESDAPAGRIAIADYAAALGDFLEGLRLRQVAVLGLRSGSLVATELAAARPAQVSRVILVSVPLLTEAERAGGVGAPSADDAARAPEQHRATQAAAQYPLHERLAKLTQRVLVLRPRDELWEATGRVRNALPAARLTELDATAAELFAAAPHRIAETMREFLQV
jgi:pimeloyl-ACP methyl ester carboxylesterase